jgi:hypothetical protein
VTPITVVPANTPQPNPQPQNPPQQNPPQPSSNQQSANDCAAKLAYAKSMHEYNLATKDSIYRPLISFYENLIQEAIAAQDALALVQYKRELDSTKNQLNAAIKAENQRYASEIAYIKSTCK